MKLPPFLLGATILFWGWQTGFWLAAIPLAIAYESSRYINWRWELLTADFRNVSHVCTVLLVGVLIYLLLNDRSLQLIFAFFQWLPIICAPLLIAQAYSTSDRVDLHALLFFKEGTGDRQQLFPLDLTYPYFALCILAASAANVRDSFYWGAVVLISWGFISIRSQRFSAGLFICLLLLSVGLGLAGHTGMHNLQLALQYKTSRFFYRFYRPQTDPNQTSTAIGDIGSVKLSNQIVLRIKPAPGEAPPKLIRQAAYNKYAAGFWAATNAEFEPVESGAKNSWILKESSSPSKEITISESLEAEQDLLKLPDGSVRVNRLTVEQIEQNQYGTVQITGQPGLLSYQILYDPLQLEDNPPMAEDLRVPEIERDAIAQIAAELDLDERSPQEILSTVRQFFDTEFSYSLKLALQRRNRTPLSAFLLDHRLGHCEYFATATTLLLREAGIPARYAVGYSVHEFSQWERQYIVRGRHAHAWTQVYLDGKWQAFDTTPSAWIAIEDDAASDWQYVRDFMSFIWFKLAQGRLILTTVGLKYLWWLAIPLAVIVARQFMGDRNQRSIKAFKLGDKNNQMFVGADSELYLIEQELTKLGLKRDRYETWRDWFKRMEREPEHADLLAKLDRAIVIHYRYRFDPDGITVGEREQLRSICLAWLERDR